VRPLDDIDLNGISTNDALFVATHAWALDTPTAVTVGRRTRCDGPRDSAVRDARRTRGDQARCDRDRYRVAQDKRAGDASDLYRILVDLDADETVRNALATGSSWSV
jgi:hypothetical protein